MPEGRSDLNAIAQALEIYKTKTGNYPASWEWRYSNDTSSPWIPGLDTNYMNTVPIDPINTPFSVSGGYPVKSYAYAYVNWPGEGFALFAVMENSISDADKQKNMPNSSQCDR